MNKDGDDDDDDEDDISTRLKKVQPQVCTLISDRLLFCKLGKPD